METRRWLALCVLAGCASACGADGPDGRADAGTAADDAGGPVTSAALVDHTRWQRAPLDDDPFAAHQPDAVECDIAGWFVERGELEMNTGRCNYLWLSQPALADTAVGDTLSLQLRHFDLTAPEPAEAHVALLIDGEVVWETALPVPHDAEVLDIEWAAEHAVAAGATIGWHLHNHGQNTWTLAYIEVAK